MAWSIVGRGGKGVLACWVGRVPAGFQGVGREAEQMVS
jgi:hypothetical protein